MTTIETVTTTVDLPTSSLMTRKGSQVRVLYGPPLLSRDAG